MKNILIITFTAVSGVLLSQVAIGKGNLSGIGTTAVANPSISLEFGDYITGEGKGLIVPWVSSAANVTGAVPGTVIFDTSDKKMKYKKDGADWFELSKNETAIVGNTQNFDTTGVVNTSLQDGIGVVENPGAKTSIGIPKIPAIPGILVLEDDNKAMILPKVPSPHLNIVNPEPGLMVYDTDTQYLAVFNGKVWNFWKP